MGSTVGEAVRQATRVLRAAGIEDPARDCRLLMMAALGADAAQLLGHADRRLSAGEQAKFAELLARRSGREPVARIVGRRGFYGRDFSITPATLDPRPDSESIVEAALALIGKERGSRDAALKIIDIGTGSGCLLVTLLAELPKATGMGTDIDPMALLVAERNAAEHDVSVRACWRLTRSLQGVVERFDLLVANPPYVRTNDIDGLEPEVRDHDPRAALDGGADGLAVYREIAENLGEAVPEGWAIFEVGAGQAGAVEDILKKATSPAAEIRKFRDYNGVVRCVAWKARH